MADRGTSGGPTGWLVRRLPIVGWLRSYDRVWLRGDLIAGVTVAALIVPKNLGYAGIAGIPLQNGLYAAAAGAVLYAIFGTCRQISMGPSSGLAAVAASAVAAAGISHQADVASFVAGLTLASGLLFLVLAVLRMGWLAQFLSRAVVTGFLFGAAIDVVIGELPKITGTDVSGSNSFQQLRSWLGSLGDAHRATWVLGVVSLVVSNAGVPDPFLSKRYGHGKKYESHEAMLSDFADAPLNANAGKSFDYSNGNFATLAAVVEHLTGLRYDEYLKRNVFGPAGMRFPDMAPALGYARFTEYDPLGVEARRSEKVRGGNGGRERALGFGGSAYTADDLFRFARALQTGKLVPKAIADSITKGEVSMGGPMKYALGFFDRPTNGRHVVGHSGSNPDTGHDADLQMVWGDQWTVITLSNYDAPAGMMLEMPILDLVTGSAIRR